MLYQGSCSIWLSQSALCNVVCPMYDLRICQVAVETVARKRKVTAATVSGSAVPCPLVGPPPAAHAIFLPVRRGLLYSPIVMRAVRNVLSSYAEKVRVAVHPSHFITPSCGFIAVECFEQQGRHSVPLVISIRRRESTKSIPPTLQSIPPLPLSRAQRSQLWRDPA